MRQAFYAKLEEVLTAGESVLLATAINSEADGRPLIGQKALLCRDGLLAQEEAFTHFWRDALDTLPPEPLPRVAQIGTASLLLERLAARPTLYICGGGHIALPLATLGALLEFDVTVLDDRAEFANAERFPMANTIICAPFEEAMAKLPYDENAYFVIVTRGHTDDRCCLEAVLDHSFGYVGMIGSRRKVALVMEELARQGRSPALLEQVHAPIGLKIGAQTPAEIAVCIAAEIIGTRSGAAGGDLEPAALSLLASGGRAMLATIIEKHGSSPRGLGAKLLADENGRLLFGTTGGGAGEAQVLALTAEVLAAGVPRVITCNMSNDDARRAGMICGGTITVLLEPML